MNTLVKLEQAVFKLAGSSGKQIFNHPICFAVAGEQKWAVLGPTKTQFLKALASQYQADPPLSRTYPFLNKAEWPESAIQFLEFKGVLPTAHLAARYEFFKDEFDETTRKFVIGNVNNHRVVNADLVEDVFKRFKLEGLEDRWSMGLSNGQTRRARLARALVREPKLMVIDDPFLGLDPEATETVSTVLGDVPPNPYVILGLRAQDEIPKWITHVVIVNQDGVVSQGTVAEMGSEISRLQEETLASREAELAKQQQSIQRLKRLFPPAAPRSVPLLEFRGVSVAYRGQPVLTDLNWKVNHGERWHVRGNNGAGKSTLLSLITAEHPQSWNARIVMNGVARRTGSQSYFDINESIGFTSPELHAIYPAHHTLYETIATGFQAGSMIPPKKLSEDKKHVVGAYLQEFELEDKINIQFRDLNISDQKLALFIRALVKNPDLVILDEALSVMDGHTVQKCKELLRHYNGTVMAIGHLKDEEPDTDRFIRLVRPGEYEVR